jgi:hypothetical protein
VKRQILDAFKNAVKEAIPDVSVETLARLCDHTKNGTKIQKQLKDARRSGERCRRLALWIGVERYVLISS